MKPESVAKNKELKIEPPLEDWGMNPSFWIPRKISIAQIINDLVPSKQARGVFVDSKVSDEFPIYYKVAICGMVLSVEEKYKRWIVTVDDSTGKLIRCNYFLPSLRQTETDSSALNDCFQLDKNIGDCKFIINDQQSKGNVSVQLMQSLKSGKFVAITGRLDEHWEERTISIENIYLLSHPNDELVWNGIGIMSQ